MRRTNLMSNGRLTSFASGDGICGLLFRGKAVNRWHPDRGRQQPGYLIFVRDLDEQCYWPVAGMAGRRAQSSASDEVCVASDLANTAHVDVSFEPGVTTYTSAYEDILTTLEAFVLEDADAELRRLTISNASSRTRRLDMTSYVEIVLNDAAADAAHPAFSKLFVQTRFDRDTESIRAWRRLRSPDERSMCFGHASFGAGSLNGFETRRMIFLGRGRHVFDSAAMDSGVGLKGGEGSVLDPSASLRRSVTLLPGEAATMCFVVAAGETEEDVEAALRAALGSNTNEQLDRARRSFSANLGEALEQSFGEWLKLNHALLFCSNTRMPSEGASTLESLETAGIDAARPVLLLDLARLQQEGNRVLLLQETMAAWRRIGTPVQAIAIAGEGCIPTSLAALEDVVVLNQANLPPGVHELIASIAFGTFPDEKVATQAITHKDGKPRMAVRADGEPVVERPDVSDLIFHNGYGGFSSDGSEYVIDVILGADGRHVLPPQPWTNVIAREDLGFFISERGAGNTWAVNSRENRLTPWFNDPVSDSNGEAVYIRDETMERYWSAAPGPCPAPAPYRVRHGIGYSTFEAAYGGLRHEASHFVRHDAPVRITRVIVENTSDEPREVSVFAYFHLVLGGDVERSRRFVTTEWDAELGTILARNPVNNEFRDLIVVAGARSEAGAVHHTTDRRAFLGEAMDVERPRAVEQDAVLGGSIYGNGDPAAVLQVRLNIPPGATAECSFYFGATDDAASLPALLEGGSAEHLAAAIAHWRDVTGRVRIETPMPELDILVNNWLTYQNLSCRMMARNAFYQSGGAFGYRDQLQDAAALMLIDPSLTRRQIIRHARHQFIEGDVMHWWHPPTSRGIRTRFADDLLWLPLVTSEYVEATGDASVLDEVVPFMTAPHLVEGEDERFLFPETSAFSASVFEHCCLALERGMTHGRNGLPLIGTGDWNDGMNRVGRLGKGESVWLGFFIHYILDRFMPVCEARGEHDRVKRYRAYQKDLRATLNGPGWDGAWYRRAFYDDGEPIGSRDSDECRIDALVQAWSVLSRVAPADRRESALDAVERHLVDEEAGIIKLLTPAFDKTPHDPGYIKGYVPGVRENGGQYTHGILWFIRAMAEAGRTDRAAELLRMITPIRHAMTTKDAGRYVVEPYVVAADIYGEAPHRGRGGWTWYTGSAGWMHRVAVESILGLSLRGGTHLIVHPAIPADWPGYAVAFTAPTTSDRYVIKVENPGRRTRGVRRAMLDNEPVDIKGGAALIPIVGDGGEHRVYIEL